MRAVVYQIDPDNSFRALVNEKEFAEILSYIEDGVLTAEGISRLCSVLGRMKTMCDETGCDGFSALRRRRCAASVTRIRCSRRSRRRQGSTSGCFLAGEEAYYDYIGLQSCIKDDKAAGFDLGGGSAQVFYYDDYGLVSSTSKEIGALAMYNQIRQGALPEFQAARPRSPNM